MSSRARFVPCVAGVTAVLTATAALAGCGTDDRAGGGPGAGRPAVQADLGGRSFVATGAKNHDLVDGTSVIVGFTDIQGREPVITVAAGCRPKTGPYSLFEGKLQVLGYYELLAAGSCGDALSEQAKWLEGLLEGKPRAHVRNGGDVLELSTADETVTFAFKAPLPREFVPATGAARTS